MKKSTLFQLGFLVFALLIFSASAIAQRRISGVVDNAKTNSPRAAATISVRVSKTSAISKKGDEFEITMPAGKNFLTISFLGYDTKLAL